MLINETTKASQSSVNSSTAKSLKAGDASFNECLANVSSTSNKTTTTLDDIFEKAADKYDVSVSLLKAIGYAESSFNPNATSHCGAQGIMQLMPATAKSLGVTDAYDPEQNIMGGAKYISGLLDKYNGDTTLALAAYNAGSGNVAKYGGVPPFKETQNYVVKVQQYMKQDLNADKTVTVSGGSSADKDNTTTVAASNVWNGTFDTSYTPEFIEGSENVITTQDTLDELFSYDTYELFLKLFTQDEEEESNKESDTTLSQINMNPTIANLLRNINA